MISRLYIVDDDDAVRLSLHGLLAIRPDRVIRCFDNGDSFLGEAGQLAPGVLLLDYRMPGRCGLEILAAIKLLHPGKFAALILSGAAREDIAARAVDAGALAYIEKPFQAEKLLRAIEAAFVMLAGRSDFMASTYFGRQEPRSAADAAQREPRGIEIMIPKKPLIEPTTLERGRFFHGLST